MIGNKICIRHCIVAFQPGQLIALFIQQIAFVLSIIYVV